MRSAWADQARSTSDARGGKRKLQWSGVSAGRLLDLSGPHCRADDFTPLGVPTDENPALGLSANAVPNDCLGNKRESRPAIRRSGSRAKSASAEGRVRRQRRYALREESWEHSSIRRVRLCGRVRARRADGRDQLPEIRAVDEGTCYWSGVARCGSVWACPVCSPKIRHERALEVRPGCRRGSPKATASCS